MKTILPTKSAPSAWYLIDAAGQTPGKVATEAARHLAGKHRADYTPQMDLGDGIIVVNASKVRMTGTKATCKMYHTHSGYRGKLKSVSAGVMLGKKPENIIKLAVAGMLPKNKLKDNRLKRLRVFAAAEHGLAAQKPVPLTLA